jgi:hypothetical protein
MNTFKVKKKKKKMMIMIIYAMLFNDYSWNRQRLVQTLMTVW